MAWCVQTLNQCTKVLLEERLSFTAEAVSRLSYHSTPLTSHCGFVLFSGRTITTLERGKSSAYPVWAEEVLLLLQLWTNK